MKKWRNGGMLKRVSAELWFVRSTNQLRITNYDQQCEANYVVNV